MASHTAAAQDAVGSAGRRLMAPPLPRAPAGNSLRKPLVLEEEEWAEALEAIIERDFFPDIPKLQSKLEWLQALRTRDPEVLRLAQQNIAARRAGLRTPIGATPGSFETPGASILRGPFGGGGMTTYLTTPASTPVLQRGPVEGQRDPLGHTHPSGGAVDGRDAPGEDGPDGAVRQAPPMSLDRFLAKHTSEDNASFADLLAAMNKRRRAAADARNPLHVQAALLLEDSLEQDHRPTDGFGTAGQEPLRMLVWPHKQKNTLFYDGSQQTALALSDTELAQRVAGPPKSISHPNTRFSAASDAARGPGTDTPSSVGTPSTDAGQPAGGSAGPGAGYGLLATPSFTPGGAGDESPIMTWGDIASTPLRLGDDDMPEGADTGPSFRIAPNRRKEEVGRRMAVQAGAALKRRATGYIGTPLARQAAEAAAAAAAGLKPPTTEERLAAGGGSLVRTPTGARTPLAGSRQTPLSAAGRRLVQSIRAKTPVGSADAVNKQLRASYRSPAVRTRAGTPGFGRGGSTPYLGSAGDMTPELKLQRLRQAALAEKAGAQITDDLLNFD